MGFVHSGGYDDTTFFERSDIEYFIEYGSYIYVAVLNLTQLLIELVTVVC